MKIIYILFMIYIYIIMDSNIKSNEINKEETTNIDNDNDNDNMCIICFEDNLNIIIFNCNHSICLGCYEKLLNSKGKILCPMCRDIIEMNINENMENSNNNLQEIDNDYINNNRIRQNTLKLVIVFIINFIIIIVLVNI
jgi:hypothetical protein